MKIRRAVRRAAYGPSRIACKRRATLRACSANGISARRFNHAAAGFDEFYGFLHEGHFFVPEPWDGATTMLRRKVLAWRWDAVVGRSAT